MKEIIYEDCNNNIQFIKEMFLKIGLMVKEELMWNISNFDSVPVNSEDYSGVGRTVNDSRQRVYLFQQRILNEHTVVIGHKELLNLFGDIRTIYEPGSSVAQIKEKEYFLHNLFAAMLVPSGNDAAYVVADYCGGLLSPQAESCQERVRIFMENLNLHLQQQGYLDTVLYDPSGFDMEALTTTLDLKEVVYRLLEYSWFREIVSQNTYTATLPDGSTQIWKNTNAFLDPTSEYYNENVCGIKTGSLSDDYNLIVLYQQHGKEFLICSLGSQSDSSRYDDVNFILKTIDESYYLTQ